MAISYVGAGAADTGSTLGLNAPAGIQSGDLLLLSVTNSTVDPTDPSGWTRIGTYTQLTVYYKVTSGTESTVVFTGLDADAAGVMVAYRGVASLTAGNYNYSANTSSPTTLSITTTEFNSCVVSIYGATPTTSTYASRSNRARTVQQPSSTVRGLLIQDIIIGTPASTTRSCSTTSSSTDTYTIAIALAPASSTLKSIVLTSGTTWAVPAELDTSQNVSVVCIGGGGGGARPSAGTSNRGGGGGGGGGVSISTLSLAGVTTAYMSIGAAGAGATANNTAGSAGGQTWFNKSTNAAPTLTSDGALANGGSGGSPGTGSVGAGGAGGSTTGAVGDFKYSGGNGAASGNAAQTGGGGGGSAAKLTSNGFAGGSSGALTTAAGGGGGGISGAGAVSTSTSDTTTGGIGPFNQPGGDNTAGFNGSGGGGGFYSTFINRAGYRGGDGLEITVESGGSAGFGGGGGGGSGYNGTTGTSGGAGGLYGGGGGGGGQADSTSGNGGSGAQGAIIITYYAFGASSNFFFLMQ